MDADDALQLVWDAATNVLTASYSPPPAPVDTAVKDADTQDRDDPPAPPAVLPAWDSLAALATAQGWPLETLDSQAIIAFVNLCREATAPVQMPVGKLIDGSFELEVDASSMSAQVILHPPKGGKPVSFAALRQAIADYGIVHGVLEEALAEALAQNEAQTVLIAQGTPPTPGIPTRFESLLDRLKPRAQEIDELAQIDYRDLGSLLLVTPGTPLMRRIPPLPGIDGSNVLGEPVLPAELPDTPFSADIAGVEIDPEDPNLLRAAIAGSPKLIHQGVQVNPVVEVGAVDLSTGNIHFEGSLLVRGDINATMEVRVTGDVVVNGTIEAALVEAGGAVTVKGGIIGMVEAVQDNDGDAARTAHIICGGDLKARFIANAIISAGQSVEVEREIRQSSIAAGGSVNVGPPNTQQTTISGGQTRALKSVRAGTIGSPVGVPTLIQAGLDPHADIKRSVLIRKRLKMNEEKDKLEKLLLFLQAHPGRAAGDVVERARNTHAKLDYDLIQLSEEENQLIRDLQPLHSATIIAARRFCSGVKIQLGNRQQVFLEDQIGGKAALEDDKIVIR